MGKFSVEAFGIVFIFLGSLRSNDLVWELTDMFNQLVVTPNTITLFAIGGMVATVAKRHKKNNIFRGLLPCFFIWDGVQ